MSGFNPTPAVFHKRRDGSMFMSFGNPIHGFHNQFDFYGVEKLGERIAVAVNAYDKQRALIETLTAALEAAKTRMRNCRGAVESNQVVDKDVRGSLNTGIRDIEAALSAAKEITQ